MSKLFRKIAISFAVLAVSVCLVGPAQALTADELQAQITALTAQLAALQTQLGTGTTTTTGTVAGCTITAFDRNLAQGASGNDVKCLQIILNANGAQVSATGAGSPGSESTYFGAKTKAAVSIFQKASVPGTSGTGFVGAITRAKLNTLIGAGAGTGTTTTTTLPAGCTSTSGYSPTTGASCATGTTTTVPAGVTGLTVGLASDTPASTTIADAANGNFTKLTFTAGGTAVSVSQIYVTRGGLSANADVENIKIVDMNSVNVGSVGSLNTNGQALLTFIPALTIPANTSASYYIRAGIVDATSAGKTVTFGINASTDITAGGAIIGGTFPITGNPMSTALLAIGTLTVVNDGTVTDSTPDVGDTDVINNQFKLTTGSVEAVTVEQITLQEAGTASLDDTANIELYDVSHAKSLGTVAGWSADGKVSFTNLNLVIGKGETVRFKVMSDIIDGSGLTVNTDLTDGSDVLVTVKGNTYGFYLTPTVLSSWIGQGGTTTATNQTIAAGALNISKSSTSPATGNIAQADDQIFTIFDFDSRGESMKITSLKISFDLTAMTEDQITNVRVYDENGVIVAGPGDVGTTDYTANGTTYEGYVTFTDTIITAVGVHKYTVKGKIATTTTGTTDKLVCSIADPDSDITAKGMQTNETVTAAPAASNVSGNQQTIKAGALTAVTLSQPAARSITKGIQDYVWATVSLDATGSGEDVLVTALVVEDTFVQVTAATGGFADIDNLEIWADLTSVASSRGDIYETKVSNTEQPAGATGTGDFTKAITLSQTVRVAKNTAVKIAIVGDLSTGATVETAATHAISLDTDAADVTATGADTGSTVDVTPTGGGQVMTVAALGTLTVSLDSSSPVATILLGNAQKTTLGVFRLTANNVEDQDLDAIVLTDDGAVGSTDVVSTYYIYSSKRADLVAITTPIATAAGGATVTVQITDGTVTIPADGYVLLTVKGDINTVDGTQVVNEDTVEITVAAAGDIDSTGKSSGSAIASAGTSVDAGTHILFKSRPYFSVNASSPSGSLIPGTATQLAIFDIKADAGEDITFDTGDSDQIVFQVSVSRTDSDVVSEDWWLKGEDGTEYCSGTAADNLLTAVTDITCTFATALTIPAGETKKIYLTGTTSDLETAGDSIQIWLDDGTAANVEFGVNSTGAYAQAVKVFKGDIYAGALVKP